MVDDPIERVFAIFDVAVARPERERAGFVADACQDDPELREEVESLLAAHKEADGFLSSVPPLPNETQVDATESSSPTMIPGTRLGVFEIESFVGAGGMGEVYKARDTRLDRSVAIKVLSPAAAADPNARARFIYEARAIASLSHPRICALHDVGHDRVDFLVMEYLQGETLAAKLRRKPLSLGEALRIAIEIADALIAAHSRGIVHRDLKPGNVMVTATGVKLLDFGLARLRADRTRPESTMPGLTLSETSPGVILGTLRYMAPEQLEGRDVDTRADIFSFGAVLYEMVTGRKAFDGQRDTQAIASILSSHPPAAMITPLSLGRVIRTCLETDRDNRWTSIHDVRLQLQSIAQEGGAPAVERAGEGTRPSLAHWRLLVPWTIAALMGVACVLILRWPPWPSAPRPVTELLSVELGVDGALSTTDVPFVLSRDGTLLAFVARTSGRAPRLHVRRLDQLSATPLSGTEGASTPCFSPDAQWLAFFADLKLKKVQVTGGAVVTLAEAPSPRGIWWAEDGTIVFAPHYRMGLMRVSSAGGQTQPLTTLTNGEISHRFPQVLPGGAGVLYTASTEVNIGTGSTLVVQPLPSGERIIVQRGGYFGRYVASGHIVYIQDDTLFGVPFDHRRLKATGPAGRTIDGVKSDISRGSAQFTLSETGTMAYVAGRNTFDARPMAWMDRAGGLRPLRPASADWYNPEFSPDGQRIAVDIRGAGHSDIWVYDWARDTLTRVTSESTNEEFPVWTPDGTRITYRSFTSSTDPSGHTIYWKRADGTGEPQVLVRSKAPLTPGSWHPNKKLLAYVAAMPGTGEDVMILPVEGDEASGWKTGQPTAFVNSAARDRLPTFSPDGRWLSYTSNESGKDQVYVRPFPGPGARVMVSSGGGHTSSWSRTRPEMVFVALTIDYRQLPMVARYRVKNDSFLFDKPGLWAESGATIRELLGSRMYALHPDGVRLAVAPPLEGETAAQTHLTFVRNFTEELRRIAPTKH
jgi:eukaryotic-like serine/threonine-protein kinase